MENKIEVFLQGIGLHQPTPVKVPVQGRVRDLIEAAKEKGLKLEDGNALQVWLENQDEPLPLDLSLAAAGIQLRSRVQLNTCPRIHVTVNFQSESESHPFSPAATMQTIKQWAAKKYKLSERDAGDYALELCDSDVRPSDETHVGSLVAPSQCQVCFDLVAQQRIEG